MCLYPRIVNNPKYQSNKKNKGVVPTMTDKRVAMLPVGCGKCMECRKQKANEWIVRLNEEVRENKNGKFVTLTFSEETRIKTEKEIIGLDGYELDNEVAKVCVNRFRERWRKKYGKKPRMWLITELGGNGTERIHLHGIIWTDENKEAIEERWRYGSTWVGKWVNGDTIGYIVKYLSKGDIKHKEYKPKMFYSNGLGRGYTERADAKNNKYKKGDTKEYYRDRKGFKKAIPVYWRNKIYSDEEKEKLWIEKLDKQERWVDGKKIDISKGEEEYWGALKYARKKNKRLGYGDDSINWERKRYERDMRNIKRGLNNAKHKNEF